MHISSALALVLLSVFMLLVSVKYVYMYELQNTNCISLVLLHMSYGNILTFKTGIAEYKRNNIIHANKNLKFSCTEHLIANKNTMKMEM